MKRLLCIAVVAVLFVSCAKGRTGDPLSVLDGDVEAKISTENGGHRCEFIYKGADKSIEFTYPAEIAGFVLTVSENGATLSFDGISVGVSEYAGRLIFLIESVFSRNASDVTSINATKNKGGTVTVVKTAEYTYTFDTDGAPISIVGIYADIPFEMTFLSFVGASK